MVPNWCCCLIYLHPGVHFINVLLKAFTPTNPKCVELTVKLSIFYMLLGSTSVKPLHKTLMKMTPGVNFINIFTHSFCDCSSPRRKSSFKSSVSFYAFGIYERKSCTKNVDEIDTRGLKHAAREICLCSLRSSQKLIFW